MRIYEELFIVRPDATDEEVDPVIEQLKNVITNAGGTLDKTEKWGVRKLAYRVMKQAEGQYILLQFTAGPETVKEIERRLRVADLVTKPGKRFDGAGITNVPRVRARRLRE